MLSPPVQATEESRLEAVLEYGPYEPFDDEPYAAALELALDLFEVPTAFVTFIDRDEQVFPLRRGLALCRTSREVSFCAHVVAQEDMLVVLDATLDPRFFDNPLVIGDPHIRFYAGTPLIGPTGYVIGTLCLVDSKPRNTFSDTNRRHLKRIAEIVLDRLELRRLQLASRVNQDRFERISATSPDSIICANSDGRITFWNAAAERMFGHLAVHAVGQSLDLIVPTRMRKGHDGGLRRVAKGGQPRLVGRLVELMGRRADDTEFPVELSLTMWGDGEQMHFGAILRDISERRIKEEQLFRLAHHDPLTELPNRMVLRRRIDQIDGGTEPAALLMVDLDGFKSVNDDRGHAAGDEVLREVSRRLLTCVRSTDTVARLGGDEFAVLLPGVRTRDHAEAIADAVIQSISHPITVEGENFDIGASIGIAYHPGDGSNTSDLLSSADLALYRAKNDGRSCHRSYTPELRIALTRARAYDSELRRAYECGEFEVFYQPQIRLADMALVGAEALLRWRHPRDGLLSPAAFMSGLENRPISMKVGQWVLGIACTQAAIWRQSGAPGFRIGVNLFGSQFRSSNLVEDVQEALAASRLPASALELEVTENIILRHDETVLVPLRRLRERGVQIAFDDYGTGYASLSMLRHFPITRLKIDKSFVEVMCETPSDTAIVRAILYLGHSLGLSVIAEGVETEQQADLLRQEGCKEVQGYYYGRPMPAAEFSAKFELRYAQACSTQG